MNEIKITKGSLENAILKNGQFVSGYVRKEEGSGSIDASGYGAHAEGFVEDNISIIANGVGAHAEGISTQALAAGAHAEGYYTKSIGDYSHAEGQFTKASGQYSHAEGYYTTASATAAHASGFYTIANRLYETVIGKFNAAGSEGDLFVVGCGDSTASRSNAMRVNAVDENDSQTIYWYFNDDAYLKYWGDDDRLLLNHHDGHISIDSDGGLYMSESSGDSYMWVYEGDVGIQSSTINLRGVGGNGTTVSVTGRVNATQGFFQTSDINKKNILGDIDLQKAYDLIDKCQEILYSLKDDKSNKQEIGMIAQEVNEFFPELISKDNNGYLSLDYSKLTVIILKVMKDLIRRIDKLENKD